MGQVVYPDTETPPGQSLGGVKGINNNYAQIGAIS
jgi:hypothetical protein